MQISNGNLHFLHSLDGYQLLLEVLQSGAI